MFKSMSMHKKDNLGTVKSNFVTCLVFGGLIPTPKSYTIQVI